MHILLPIIGVAPAWAWLTGRLKQFTVDDALAAAAVLLGVRFVTMGRPLTGAIAIAGGLLYAGWRRGRFAKPDMPVEDARRLLGLPADAMLAEIRSAHRRLIARVHPDAGGSAELASRINAARDALIAEQAQSATRRRDSLS